MKQIEQAEQSPKQKTSLTIIIIIAVLMFLMASAIIFRQNIGQFITGQFNSWAQSFLIKNIKNNIGNEIEVSLENFDLTIPGQAKFVNVKLSGENQAVLAQIPEVRVYYRWFDFAKREFDYVPRLEKIVVRKGEFFVHEENSKLNWSSLLEPKGETIVGEVVGGRPGFNGIIEIVAGKINLKSPILDTVLEEVNGEIDFDNPGDIVVGLTAKIDRSLASIKGVFRKEPGEISFYIDQPFDLARFDFDRIFPSLSGFNLTSGSLQNFTLVLKRNNENNWQLNSEGEFSGLGLVYPIDISQGNGKFTANNAGISFDNLSLMLLSQKASGQGNIVWQKEDGGPEKTVVNFSLNLPDVDPTGFVSGLPAERPLVVSVNFTGPLPNPEVFGNFSIPRLNFSGMPVNEVTGKFHYSNNSRLILEEINGSILEGTILANGELFLDNGAYELDILGKKLDSTLLIDKNLHGFFEFNAHLSNRNKGALTKGNFIIRDGSAYGTLFQSVSGFFVKKDDETIISDIAVRTDSSTFYPEALNKNAFSKFVSS